MLTPAARSIVLTGTKYNRLRNAAVAAARRNGASLWFAGAPADLAGYVWQDSAGTTPAIGTDPIGRLTDRAGSNSATQATAANKPTLELQANGYYGILGDGTADNFDIASLLQGTGDLTIVVASKDPNETVVTRRFFGGAGGGTGLIEFYRNSTTGTASLRVRDNAGVDTFTTGPVSPFDVPYVFSGVKAGNNKTVYANGVAGGANPTATGASTITTTKLFSNSAGGANTKGPVFLICAAQVNMPAPDRIAIERFAALLSGAAYP